MKTKTLLVAVTLPAFDISNVIGQLSHLPDCRGWSAEKMATAEAEYRKYLALAKQHPAATLVPSPMVDTIWHRHMLNSRQYMSDSQDYFGYYLHHQPHPRYEADTATETNHWLNTLRLYEETFGESASPSLGWKMRAAECGCGGCSDGCSG